ncbi:MAG: ribosome maturation factor RimP [Acidimicrobiales bacterium]
MIAERVHDIVEPLLAPRHLEVVDVEHVPPRLRVTVDREGGVDLDTLSEVTQLISRALDEHDPVPGRYTLEVSSPGLERPLRTPAHFVRAVGSQVAVRTRGGIEPRRIRGELVAADDDGVTIRLDSPPPDEPAERHLGYDQIERARTVFEWGPTAPKPGKQGTSKRTKKKAHQ